MVSSSSNRTGEFFMDPNGVSLPGISKYSAGAGSGSPAALVVAEDLDKRIRKPYTSTKSRQSWTDPEHDKFLEALHLFDRDWKKIEAFIGSKTVIQIRSHAQKYFLKVQKGGGNEHLPPPRPKRKAAHPYPHKASMSAPVKLVKQDVPSFPDDPTSNAAGASSWTDNSHHIPSASQGDFKSNDETTAVNTCSSAESAPRVQSFRRMPVHANKSHGIKVLPDFAQVYGFIGSVFDPNVTGHLQNLKQMDPIDVETALLLMRNLSINLSSPNFEDHRKVLSTYVLDPKDPSYDVIGV